MGIVLELMLMFEKIIVVFVWLCLMLLLCGELFGVVDLVMVEKCWLELELVFV